MNSESTNAPAALARTPCSASCCFNCTHWNGQRRKDKAYCYRLNLSGKDATRGNAVCVLWEQRANSRMPNSPITGATASGASESSNRPAP